MSEENGPPDARYTATDSSFMQGTVFLNYLKDFHKQLGERGLLDGKPHVLVFDDHASHVYYDAIKLAVELDIVPFQLPFHASHITQPSDVPAFGSSKKEGTKVLTASYPFKHGGTLPLECDMAGMIGEAWRKSFSPDQNKASFAGAGLWPVDMDRAVGRLQGTGKRKPRPTDRPPLANVPIAASQKQLEEGLGERALRRLRASGHSIQGLRVGTVMLGGILRQRKRAKKLPTTRAAAGVPDRGMLTSKEILDAYAERERANKAVEEAKAEKAKSREQKRADKKAASLARHVNRGGWGGGRGGGRREASGGRLGSERIEGGREGGREGRAVGDGHRGGRGAGGGGRSVYGRGEGKGGRGWGGGEEGIVPAVVEEWREQERPRWSGVSRRPPYPCQGDTGRRHL